MVLALSLSVSAASGAIWTTNEDCGLETQDVNQFPRREVVVINGDNWDPGVYDWAITGQPGGSSCDPSDVVASGTVNIDGSGEFCVIAYTVALDDCGTYTVDVDDKNDNYRVDETL